MSMNILIVEDEPKLANILREALFQNDYTCDVAYDGLMGKKLALNNTYHLAILDIIIPYLNGIDLCKEIRQVNNTMPILFLTALGTTDDKIAGFDAGADDYLVKPFEIKELLARIKALTRRSSGFTEKTIDIKVADLTLNLDRKTATRGNKNIELTAKEFALLEYLMRNKGRVLTRTIIAEKVWDIDFDTGTNVVDVYINFLRKKIDKEFEHKLIQTKIGAGYFLDDK